jgi:hypothetical protein
MKWWEFCLVAGPTIVGWTGYAFAVIRRKAKGLPLGEKDERPPKR